MSRTYQKSHSEELKKRVVEEIESGLISISAASKEYITTKTSIKNWLEDYGKYKPKRDILEIVMKDEKEKIAELEQALSDAHLKLRIYDKILDLASKDYKTDLKKTIGPKASELLKGKVSK